MKHLYKGGALMGLFVLWAVGFFGLPEANAKIGIIDTQEVLRNSRAAEEARIILLEDLKEKRNLFNQKQDEVRLLEEELKIKGDRMAEPERRERSDLLSREIRNLQRLKTDLEEELNKKDVELTRRILEEVKEVIIEFRKKHKYWVILEKNNTVVFDENLDITKDIIKIYDARKK